MRDFLDNSNAIDLDSQDYEIESENDLPIVNRKLIRLRRKIAALKLEISNNILAGAVEFRENLIDSSRAIGDLNAAINKDKKYT